MTSLRTAITRFLTAVAAAAALCASAFGQSDSAASSKSVSDQGADKIARFADSLEKELSPGHAPETLPARCPFGDFTEGSFAQSLALLNEPFMKDSAMDCGLALYRNFLRTHARHRRALLGFAQLLGWAGRHEQSYYTYLYIDRYYPYDEEVGMGLATVLSWGKRTKRSEGLLRSIGERYPDNVNVQVHLARIYTWQGKYKLAIATGKKAVRKDTNNIYALKVVADASRWARKNDSAFKYYQKITTLSEDSALIRDSYFQLAGLDWDACRNKSAIARLEALAVDSQMRKQSVSRVNQYRERLGWNLGASAFRYGEYGYKESSNSYAFGLANNSISCSAKKGFNRVLAASARYSFGNETMENFLTVKQPQLYDVMVHEFGAGLSLDAGDAFTGTLIYTPYLYFRNDKSANIRDVNLLLNPYFHGGRFFGNAAVPGGRTYFGLGWAPQITRTLRKIVMVGKAEMSLAYSIKIPGGWALTPVVEDAMTIDTATNRITGSLEVLKRFERQEAGVSAKVIYRTYDRWVDNFFTYREWITIKLGMDWDHLFCKGIPQKGFSMPLSWYVGGDMLTERRPPAQQFLSISLSAKPTWHFSHGNFITFSLGGSFTTSKYATYFAGLSYDFSTAKRR